MAAEKSTGSLRVNKSVPIFLVPQNAGGFGSIKEAAQVWAINELEPIQARLQQVNEWLGVEVVRFNPFEIDTGL